MADEMTTTQKRNIVILGRTGTGKKSIANQILDKQHFDISRLSSMESVTRTASSEEVAETDEKRKVHYNIKIIDTLGPYSEVINKKIIFNEIHDYSTHKVPEGVNLIIFTLRKDVYNISEEIEVFKAIINDFKDEIRNMSALVITGCEGLDEEGKQSVIQDIYTNPSTREIASFTEKGIYPVGFPILQNTLPALKESLEQGIACDAEYLRKLVLGAGVMTLRQDILRQKLLTIKSYEHQEKRNSSPVCRFL